MDGQQAFCERFGLRLPILMAPMAGACPPELAAAVVEAGGMGADGVVLDDGARIADWVARFRERTAGPLQLNVWVPDEPVDDPAATAAAAAFLARFGTPGDAGGASPDFDEQCAAMLAARPTAISSIMGLFGDDYVRRLHEQGIAWFACATTVEEALAAQEAGADVVVAQGPEAGGHRGTFDQTAAPRTTGLFTLLPRVVDAVRVPVVAAGGISDGRAVAAALALGASAVQVGTALLRAPEAAIHPAWAAALAAGGETVTTRAYSGRLARALATPFVTAWTEPGAPPPAPYPQQRGLVGRWRRGDAPGVDAVNFWSGQAGAPSAASAGETVTRMWDEARALLAGYSTR